MDFDPTTGELKGVRPEGKLTLNDAKNIYDANKKHKDDIIKGAKATANFAVNANEKYNTVNSSTSTTTKKDPLTNNAFSNLFGKNKKEI